jgi:hypothetical protein
MGLYPSRSGESEPPGDLGLCGGSPLSSRKQGTEMPVCQECYNAQREIAQMADEIAFWAYQAKWYYAAHNKMDYEKLARWQQKAIDDVFEEARRKENRERLGTIPASYDIGS